MNHLSLTNYKLKKCTVLSTSAPLFPTIGGTEEVVSAWISMARGTFTQLWYDHCGVPRKIERKQN